MCWPLTAANCAMWLLCSCTLLLLSPRAAGVPPSAPPFVWLELPAALDDFICTLCCFFLAVWLSLLFSLLSCTFLFLPLGFHGCTGLLVACRSWGYRWASWFGLRWLSAHISVWNSSGVIVQVIVQVTWTLTKKSGFCTHDMQILRSPSRVNSVSHHYFALTLSYYILSS